MANLLNFWGFHIFPYLVGKISRSNFFFRVHWLSEQWYPKMDGENNGKPYEQMDDLGVALFLETPSYIAYPPAKTNMAMEKKHHE